MAHLLPETKASAGPVMRVGLLLLLAGAVGNAVPGPASGREDRPPAPLAMLALRLEMDDTRVGPVKRLRFTIRAERLVDADWHMTGFPEVSLWTDAGARVPPRETYEGDGPVTG